MAKKNGGLKLKSNAGKKTSGNKPRKAGMFKTLKKHEKRAGVVETEKRDPYNTKRKAKRPMPVSDEFRNFDERMAAKNARRPRSTPKSAAMASPTFVMAAPTFQFNANSVTPAPREVEGFHGFMSALDSPKDAPIVNPNQVARQSKPMQCEYHGSNVFAVLDDGDEEQQKQTQTAPQTAPAFMQPATFTFATAKPSFTLQSLLRQSMQPAVDIDPDL